MIQKGILESLRLRAELEGQGIKCTRHATDAQVLAIIRIEQLLIRFGLVLHYDADKREWKYVKRENFSVTLATLKQQS